MYHLQEEQCKNCGSRTVKLTRYSQHTNGQWFETREYECGLILNFIPNFNQIKIKKQCPNHLSVINAKAQKKTAIKKLNNYIAKLDIDEQTKNRILDNIKYI